MNEDEFIAWLASLPRCTFKLIDGEIIRCAEGCPLQKLTGKEEGYVRHAEIWFMMPTRLVYDIMDASDGPPTTWPSEIETLRWRMLEALNLA